LNANPFVWRSLVVSHLEWRFCRQWLPVNYWIHGISAQNTLSRGGPGKRRRRRKGN